MLDCPFKMILFLFSKWSLSLQFTHWPVWLGRTRTKLKISIFLLIKNQVECWETLCGLVVQQQLALVCVSQVWQAVRAASVGVGRPLGPAQTPSSRWYIADIVQVMWVDLITSPVSGHARTKQQHHCHPNVFKKKKKRKKCALLLCLVSVLSAFLCSMLWNIKTDYFFYFIFFFEGGGGYLYHHVWVAAFPQNWWWKLLNYG